MIICLFYYGISEFLFYYNYFIFHTNPSLLLRLHERKWLGSFFSPLHITARLHYKQH